jgi:hypothetical protein
MKIKIKSIFFKRVFFSKKKIFPFYFEESFKKF